MCLYACYIYIYIYTFRYIHIYILHVLCCIMSHFIVKRTVDTEWVLCVGVIEDCVKGHKGR